MAATVTHTPKAGTKLTGAEYESASHHSVSVAHADLSTVTADQHHTQSHVHSADGSGTVAHSSLSSITATDHHVAPAAGPDANITVDSAGAAGTASTFARSGHGHQVATYASTPASVGTGAAGTSGTAPARGDHVHATGAGTPSTQAFGDAAATGSGPAAAMTDHKHAMPANPVAYAAPALTLGTANSAGVANSAVRTDATILAFDATTPANIGTAAVGAATVAARRDHVHATGAGTPSTSAMGDAAVTGSGPAAAMTDHKHARGTATNKLFLAAAIAKLDSATAANVGASPDLTGVVAYADAATQGAIWSFMVPADWVSGAITLQPVWSPGSTDASAHTVRWSMTAKAVASASTVTAAGTTTAFTGASAARTVGVVVYDTATSTTITPGAAGDLFRFTLQRIGADANDTYVGVVNLLGVIVSYTANT